MEKDAAELEDTLATPHGASEYTWEVVSACLFVRMHPFGSCSGSRGGWCVRAASSRFSFAVVTVFAVIENLYACKERIVRIDPELMMSARSTPPARSSRESDENGRLVDRRVQFWASGSIAVYSGILATNVNVRCPKRLIPQPRKSAF